MRDRINMWCRIKWMFKRYKYDCRCLRLCIRCENFAKCCGYHILGYCRKDESNERS